VGDWRDNLPVCHKCPMRQRPCAGPCPCKVDGKDIIQHAEAAYCPHPDGPKFGTNEYPVGWESRGLGDTIAKIAAAVGIKPCGRCKKDRVRLNKAVPYSDSGQ
jgi:hypothetical protein